MSDDSDNIIYLAHEMLRQTATQETASYKEVENETSARKKTMKAVCVAAVTAAIGSAALTSYIGESHNPITRYERVELDALVFYAARQEKINERILRQELQDVFELPSLQDLSKKDYRRIRNYLWRRIQR
ncbi:MAG: hypothetical protein WC612_02910 [Bdellovibrionales bacterium]|jgi:hypothetical protein